MTELGICFEGEFVVFNKDHVVESDRLVYDTKPFRERRESVNLNWSVYQTGLEVIVSHWRNELFVISISVQKSLPLSFRW